AQVADGELPFEKDLDHRPPDDAGGADDRDGEVLACHVGHGSAVTVAGRAPREYISGAVRDPGRSAAEEHGPRSGDGGGSLACRRLECAEWATPRRPAPWRGGDPSPPCATG